MRIAHPFAHTKGSLKAIVCFQAAFFMLQTALLNRRPLLSMPLPVFVMMPVRLAFIAVAIQILAVLMVLRVQLQGNVRDAFGLD